MIFSQVPFPLIFAFILFSCCFQPRSTNAQADPDFFPLYQEIKANVLFWEQVYSTYSVNTAIIHDQKNLSRIYTTVSLIDKRIPGAQKKNDQRIKRAKRYYKTILRTLANKREPTTREEARVAALFGTSASSNQYKTAADNLRSQTGLKERFFEGVARSGAYMRRIKKVFRDHRLPEDLAYLPHVESSFNPDAFSKFGASGMWQFTRSTGKEFMRIDYIIDERKDPLISAHAAAQLLQRNFEQLGSWPLALTAYNYGGAGMKRALNQEGNYVNIFMNYNKGHFKFASRNFYSEFLAAVKVAKEVERSGSVTFEKPRASVSVRMPAYVDAPQLCTYLGLSHAELKRYNPSLRNPVFEGLKYIPEDFLLKLPIRYTNSSLLSGAPASIFSSEQKKSKFYQVRSGDTAGAIAAAHKISLKSLIQANQLNSHGFIRIGQNLRIPSPQVSKSSDEKDMDQQQVHIVLRDDKKLLPRTPPVLRIEEDLAVSGNLSVTQKEKKAGFSIGIVEVQPDESIGLFAEWLKLTPGALRLVNNLASNEDVHPGQKIVLEFLKVSPEDFELLRFDFHQEIQEDFFNSFRVIDIMTYRVSNGDTIWDLCYKKFDVPLWLLKKYNDRLNYTRLDSSSTINIPVLKEI